MATEKRLIDANELVSILEEYATGVHYEDIFSLTVLKRIISERKTVDAVEVVRCKECRCDGGCSIQDAMNWTPRENIGDLFCSYGERRSPENE